MNDERDAFNRIMDSANFRQNTFDFDRIMDDIRKSRAEDEAERMRRVEAKRKYNKQLRKFVAIRFGIPLAVYGVAKIITKKMETKESR